MDGPDPLHGRPRASWVMGRSARWHTHEGQALRAEDAATKNVRRDLATLLATTAAMASDSVGPLTALSVLERLVRIAWRTFGRNR